MLSLSARLGARVQREPGVYWWLWRRGLTDGWDAMSGFGVTVEADRWGLGSAWDGTVEGHGGSMESGGEGFSGEREWVGFLLLLG